MTQETQKQFGQVTVSQHLDFRTMELKPASVSCPSLNSGISGDLEEVRQMAKDLAEAVKFADELNASIGKVA